jgi:hypothetical protein
MGLGLILVSYLACTIPKPAGSNFLVTGGSIHIPDMHLLAITLASVNYVRFGPGTGTIFVQIPLDGCTGGFTGLNGNHPIEGKVYAVANNTTNELEFKTGSPKNELLFAGEEATYVGNVKMEMEGGGELEVK